MLLQHPYDVGVAAFPGEIVDHQGLLCLPDPTGRSFAHRCFQQGGLHRLHAGEHTQAHGVAFGYVQDQAEIIEGHYAVQTRGQVREEARKIPIDRNRFRDLQQRAVLIGGCIGIGDEIQV